MIAPHPLAERIHDRVLQFLATAMIKVEMAETLTYLDRQQEVPTTLGELRSALEESVLELRSIMADLKAPAA